MGDIPKYLEVEPLRRLPEEGRELIGKEVWLFWKRDGEQTRVTMDNEHKLIIAGHNLDEATEDVVRQIGLIDGLKDKLTKLLLQWDDLVLYGELVRAGNGPTKIERLRPKAEWVLFDARHTFLTDFFMTHDNLTTVAHLYGLEVAPLYKTFTPNTMEGLLAELEQAKVWCRNNRIEGVVGKCLSSDTKILTKSDDGVLSLITIEELYNAYSTGKQNYLPTQDNRGNVVWSRIKNIWKNGLQPLIIITTKSGRKIKCTESHKFVTRLCEMKHSISKSPPYLELSITPAKDIIPDRHFLYLNQHLKLMRDKGTEQDYSKGFAVGFFLAEGNYIKNYNTRNGPKEEPWALVFSCSQKDSRLGYLSFLADYKHHIGKIKNHEASLRVVSSDKTLIALMHKYINGSVATNKVLRDSVYMETENFLRGLMDGYLSGDGWYREECDVWYVGLTPNQKLIDSLQTVCRLLGYDFRQMSDKPRRIIGYKTYNSSHISVRKITNRLCRGECTADQVDTIEPAGMGMTFDLELEPIVIKTSSKVNIAKYQHLYFLANGIWTHNCFDEKGEMIVFKSKIERSEIPKELFTEEELRPKKKELEGPELPPMPPERQLRALEHAYDDAIALREKLASEGDEPSIYGSMEDFWKDRALVLPLIAKHLKLEANEHGFAVPRNAYQLYLETPISKIRGDKT